MPQTPPAGQTRIAPMLAYDDAPAAIDFLQEAFGFELLSRLDMPDGSVGHAELSYHGDAIMVATTWKAGGLSSPKDLPASHAQIHCYVDDVDAHYETARAAGATIAEEPSDQFHGARSYRAVDPEGHRWMFATRVRDVSDEEIAEMMKGSS